MSENQDIQIRGDATGNIFLNGDGNIVIIHATRTIEPEQAIVLSGLRPNPYKGLSAFHEEDAAFFFGREKLTHRLWEVFRNFHELQPGSMSSFRLLSIIGPSGSGKSSVVRAGLQQRI